MGKIVNIKNSKDKQEALDVVKSKIKGLTIPKVSHDYIVKLTEALIESVEKLSNKEPIRLSISTGLGKKTIKISSPVMLPENLDAYCQSEIISFFKNSLSVKNKDGKGSISLTVKASASYALIKTFITVGLAIAVSWIITNFELVDFANFLHTYFTYPIETLFVNALQMIAIPVTFFAIICTTSFFYSYLKDGILGRKLFWRYIVSAAIAVIIGGMLFMLFQPLFPIGSLSNYVENKNAASGSLPDFLASLIPSNIMDPFISGNSIQLLVLAVIIGIAVGILRHKQTFVGKLIDALNNIFIEVLNIIFVFSPYALFFAVLGILIGAETYELGLIAVIFIAIVIGLLILVLIRLVILAINGVNPVSFIKKYKPFFAPVLITGSTIECIPENIKNCKSIHKLPSKYLTQTIPFCAHNNMDGNCLFLGVMCTALTYSCNLDINISLIAILVMFAIVLSAGAPNQPGSGIICMAVLIPAMGVNTILLIYVVLLDLMCETIIACTNNFSDITTVVGMAKREGILK